MFKKKIKLYAINPLLVALVTLGLNSANLPSDKLEINENDKSLTLSVSENKETYQSQEDSSKATAEEKSDEDTLNPKISKIKEIDEANGVYTISNITAKNTMK